MPTARRHDDGRTDDHEPRYNLADATRLLGFKDRRTLNHWMRAAGIEPVAATYGTHQKLLTRAQIEAVRAYITQQGGTVPSSRAQDADTLHARRTQGLVGDALTPEALNQIIDRLRAEWPDLLTLFRVPESLLVESSTPNYHRQSVTPRTRVTHASNHPPLPAHLVSWRAFTRLHRMRETVVRYHVDMGVERGGLPTVVNPEGWQGGVKIAFDQAGRDAFHRMFADQWGGGTCPYCLPDRTQTDDHVALDDEE